MKIDKAKQDLAEKLYEAGNFLSEIYIYADEVTSEKAMENMGIFEGNRLREFEGSDRG